MMAQARCGEECGRAVASLARTLIRLASHLSGWWLVSALSGATALAAGWWARDYILEWWER